MKQFLPILLFIFCTIWSPILASDPAVDPMISLRRQTRRIIKATHEVVEIAQLQIQIGEKYNGMLTKACLHQAYAYYLYKNRAFHQAQIYSFHGRIIAFKVIKENGGEKPEEFKVSLPELAALESISAPYDEELPVEFKNEKVDDYYVVAHHPKRLKVVLKKEDEEEGEGQI